MKTRAVRIKAHEFQKISTSFQKNCVFQQGPKAKTGFPDDILSLLFMRYHPKVYGHHFHWPCGGSSGVSVAC